MRLPLRLAGAGRLTAEPGLILAVAVSTAVFSATPLVLPEVVDEFDVDAAAGGLISGAQLAGFVVTSFLAGRFADSSVDAPRQRIRCRKTLPTGRNRFEKFLLGADRDERGTGVAR